MPENSYHSSDDVTWWLGQLLPSDLTDNMLLPPILVDVQNYQLRPDLLSPASSLDQPSYHLSTTPTLPDMPTTLVESWFPQTTSLVETPTSQITSNSPGPPNISPTNSSSPHHIIASSQPTSPISNTNPSSLHFTLPNPPGWHHWTPTQESPPPRIIQRRYPCQGCSKAFSNTSDRKRHWRYACQGNIHRPKFFCPDCGRSFTRPDAMNMHISLVRITVYTAYVRVRF